MTNFDSAWFLYGALLLLLATSFVVRIDYARIGLAAAALVALPLTLFRGSDLIYSLLVLAILAVNIGILARLWLRGTKIRFSAEEEALRREHFAGLGAVAARDLIDQGHWISAKRGEILIRENQAAPSLFYLAEGQAAVLRDGIEVGKLSGGALIGEATALVHDAHAVGLKVHVWTFRRENYFLPLGDKGSINPAGHGDLAGEITAYLATGIDGLFSDNPREAVAAVEKGVSR